MDYGNIDPIIIGKTLRELRGEKTLENAAEGIDVSTSALAMYVTLSFFCPAIIVFTPFF